MAGKKKSKGKKSSSSHKAPAAAPAHKGKGKKRRSSGGKKRGGGKRRGGGGGFLASLKSMFTGKKGGKKRRSSGGSKKRGRSSGRRSAGGGGMTLKQFAINGLKLGAMATAGWIAGEALRSYLLRPKKDGSASTLAAFEQRHLASPVFTAAITAIPGVVGGLLAYWAGKKWKQPLLQTAGGALMIGGVVSGGGRIILGNRWVAEKTDGLQLVRGGAQQQIAPAAPAPALPAAPAAPGASAGYGDAFVGNPYGYTQPPAWKQLGDAYVGNPYGDSFVPDPGGEYLARTGQLPRTVAGYGTTAAAELDG